MAINDNDNYTLTGAQVKDLAQRVKAGGGGGGVLIGYINYTAGTVPSGNISVYTDTTYTTAISADDVAAAIDNGDTVFFKFTDGWDEIKILSIADSEAMIGDDTIVYHFMASSSKDCIGQLQGHVDDWGVATFLSSLKSVNNGTLTVQHNGTTVQTFSANQSASATANVETIYADPIASSAALTPLVQTSMIADGAVTADKTNFSTYGLNTTVQVGTDIDDNTPVYRTTLGSNSLAMATSTWVLLGNLFGSGTGTVKTIYSLNFVLRDSGGTNFCAYGYDGGAAGGALGTSRPLLAKVLSNGNVLIACANDNFSAAKVRVTVEYTKN